MRANKAMIPAMIRAIFPNFVAEYAFDANRRWRFDFAIPDIKVAIEYEGIMVTEATGGKSRHTTADGYTADCEKYNAAAIAGWVVLRYTAKNIGDLQRDLSSVKKYMG